MRFSFFGERDNEPEPEEERAKKCHRLEDERDSSQLDSEDWTSPSMTM